MESINICVLGDDSVTKFCKKGTVTDVTMYNRALEDKIVTMIYPGIEKPQSIAFALQMCDFVILSIKNIDKNLGELILFANEFNKKGKIVVYDSYMVDDVKKMLHGTAFENFPILENPKSLEEIIDGFERKKNGEEKLVMVDQYFKVKGVGDVVLGFIKSGSVKVFDKLIVYPQKKECTVKSIQVMSKNYKEAEEGTRIGFSLKTDAELSRGVVLSDKNIKVADELIGRITKNKFYKKDLNGQFQVVIGLQYVSANVNSSKNELKFLKPVTLETFGNPILIIDPNSFPRIAGRFDI